MSSRIKKLQKILSANRLDGMAVTSTSNLFYLAGIPIQSFERFAALFVPAEGYPALVLPELEAEKAKEKSSVKAVRSYTDEAGPASAIKAALSELSLVKGIIGVESTLPFRSYELIVAASPRLKVKDATSAVMELRLVKGPEELEIMRKAGVIVEKGIRAGTEALQVGVTEVEIGFEIEKEIRRLGGEKVPFNAVLAGRNAALPHGESADTMVQRGDCVLMDVSATYRGYYADLTRTVFVGEVSASQRRVYEVVRGAQAAAVSLIRPGIKAGEIDRKARSVITKAGLGKSFIHRTGHGLGLDVHEEPSITSSCPLSLAPGMTFTVEPGIYLPGKMGVRIEDDLAVTRGGVETIGKCDKELLIV